MNPPVYITVVSRSPDWGENRAPRIISPSKYIRTTDAAISAPRPGRFSSKCPAPGRIHARRMAVSACEGELDEDAVGAGPVAGEGGAGNAAPGLSLTVSFYRIRRLRRAGRFRGQSPQPNSNARAGVSGSRHLKGSARIRVQKFQLLVVDLHGVFRSGRKPEDEQGLVLQSEPGSIARRGAGDGSGPHLDRFHDSAGPQGLKPAVLKKLKPPIE